MGQKISPVTADAPLVEGGATRHAKIPLPLLALDEVGDKQIERKDLPKDLRSQLQPWEDVVYIHGPKITYPTKLPSAVTEIKRLTLAPTIAELGNYGPSIASISTEENKQLESLTK